MTISYQVEHYNGEAQAFQRIKEENGRPMTLGRAKVIARGKSRVKDTQYGGFRFAYVIAINEHFVELGCLAYYDGRIDSTDGTLSPMPTVRLRSCGAQRLGLPNPEDMEF